MPKTYKLPAFSGKKLQPPVCKKGKILRTENFSQKAAGLKPFVTMDILERAQELERKGRSIIHLAVGEPDFATPTPIKKAAAEALQKDLTHYTHSLGTYGLRQTIADYYLKRYRVRIVPEQILVTSGTSPALMLACAALLNPGDRVIVSNPGYACYGNFITYCDGAPQYIKVYEDNGFQFEPQALKPQLTPQTRAILINSPANPTGNLLEVEQMRELAELGPMILSDEIYHGLVYKGEAHSILEFTDNAFVFNGFSKLYAMTGWRLGYLIAPLRYMRTLQTLQQNFMISASHFGQEAAITALTSQEVAAELENMKLIYNERRRFMLRRVREIGLQVATEPTGAFYIFANAKEFTADSYAFSFEILEKAGVGVTPGIDFGSNGEGYLRFSYANSLENIAEGMKRLEIFFKSR
ncbi:MAG TPA: pyridoxal phosphate-dependent aminotransferase [Proteobacteria bacterium]|nr:pyridoxal phosphate-dependent aminotransferase [Pseudomonadota bacterium]